jgi:MFS transporter, ACS family, tartrate transporter
MMAQVTDSAGKEAGAALGSPADPVLAQATRKAAWRLVPFLGLCYFVAFLDRVNVGFAALTMNADIGLSATAYGIGAGIFFIGYTIFEVPSNLALQRFGARRWIARIMVTWGLLSMMMAFVTGPVSFWILRFLLGVAEAGFFPGIILYLTQWFPGSTRGRIIGYFYVAVPLSNVFGAPLSTWLLQHSVFGLTGWQTMFVVEAAPAVLLGFMIWRLLPDKPRDAKWLTETEVSALDTQLAKEAVSSTHSSLKQGLLNPRVWRFGLIYFFIVVGLYGFGFFAPQLLKVAGDLSDTQTGFAVALPYAIAAIAMILWSRHSDITGERKWHVVLPTIVAAAGFALAAIAPSFEIALLAFTLCAVGIYAAAPSFWTLPAALLTGTAAASGIALVNSLGNIAGYVGPFIMGGLKDATGGYAAGLLIMSVSLVAAGIATLTLSNPKPGDAR